MVAYYDKVFTLGGVTKLNIGDTQSNNGTDISVCENKLWRNIKNLKSRRHGHCQVQLGEIIYVTFLLQLIINNSDHLDFRKICTTNWRSNR